MPSIDPAQILTEHLSQASPDLMRVLLVVGVALGYLVGVDNPGMSDSDILERLNDDARQAAAGIGLPVLAAGSRFCSGSPPVFGECWTGCPAATGPARSVRCAR